MQGVQVLLEGYSEGGMGSTILGQEQKSDSTSDAKLYCWPVSLGCSYGNEYNCTLYLPIIADCSGSGPVVSLHKHNLAS